MRRVPPLVAVLVALKKREGENLQPQRVVTVTRREAAVTIPSTTVAAGVTTTAVSTSLAVTSVTSSVSPVHTTAVSTPIVSTVPISIASRPATGEGTCDSVGNSTLRSPTQMVAKAMVAQSFKPLSMFSGESEKEPFERWLETFEDRAKVAGWVSGTEFVSIKVPSVWYSNSSVLSLSFQ